jgi:hypothetical protein
MRLLAALICFYGAGVYLMVLFNVIPQSEVTYYMRGFQIVIALYIILEARHG